MTTNNEDETCRRDIEENTADKAQVYTYIVDTSEGITHNKNKKVDMKSRNGSQNKK